MAEILAFARALHVAGSLSLFGAFMFRIAIAPAALSSASAEVAARLDRHLYGIALISLVLAAGAAPAWLILQAAAMSGAETAGELVWSTAIASRDTLFGQIFLARMALLLAAGLCLWSSYRPCWKQRRTAIGAGLSGAAVALLAAAGHAVALEGGDRYVTLSAQAVHLLAAGTWLGGLIPLALSVLILPPSLAGIATLRFSPIGMACVTALVLTAWFNGWVFVGNISNLLGTEYGRWMLVKLTLLMLMLGFAVANRFNYTRALRGPDGSKAARRFRVCITLEACVGLLAVLAAGMLVSTPPGVHAGRDITPHLH